MSLDAVNKNIRHALSDGHISTADAQRITSTEDAVFKAPVSVGTFVDKDEYASISDLYNQIKRGEVRASPEALANLKAFVDEGAGTRWKHALKGGPMPKKLMGIGAATGAGTLGTFGAVMGLGLQGWKLMLIAGPVWALGGAMVGTGVAYTAGVVRGIFDD